ncbi:nucleotidyltransferase family protein [Patescibacteria group bacterium]|nr:nucleotidyltransferase family protein [Patescibacteria group bacterium]
MLNKFIKILSSRKEFCIKSFGQSMLPLFSQTSILYYKRIKFLQTKVNDLILVKKDNILFTHRVIYKTDKYLITKGDNNLISDGRIYPKQIVGKAYQIKRGIHIINPEDIYLFQSTQYFREIVKITQRFEKEKIEYVFLKGLPLHLYFEKIHPKRIYADADLLISKTDRNKVKKILVSLDFKQANTSYSSIHKKLKDKDTEVLFYKKLGVFFVNLDIHLEAGFLFNQLGRLDSLYKEKYIDEITDQFIKSRKYVHIQNNYFPILLYDWLVIYLCLHFFHHNFRGIYRLELADSVIRKKFVNKGANIWIDVEEKIIKYKLQNFVYPSFLLLKKYSHTPLPSNFLNSIKPNSHKINFIKNNILSENIFDDETRMEAGVKRFKNLYYLSPNPLYIRLLVFLNIQVIYSFFWVMIFLLRRSVKSILKSF